jgi:hypothetical protein
MERPELVNFPPRLFASDRWSELKSAITRELLALCSNDDSGYVRSINRGVKKFCAGQLRKMNQLISDFFDFPTIFSPDFIRSSTVWPVHRCRIVRMVSLGCNSILLWANKSEQTKARATVSRSDRRFMIGLFCPRTAPIASE